jgi:hypothetical protein
VHTRQVGATAVDLPPSAGDKAAVKRTGSGSDKLQRTPEQEAIIRAAHSKRSFRILALAGTGKTTTLIQIAREIEEPSIYLAFNNAIAKDASGRFPRHVKVRTGHSLAWDAYVKPNNIGDRIERNPWAIREAMLAQFPKELASIGTSARSQSASFAVFDTLSAFMNSAAEKITAAHVPPKHAEFSAQAVVKIARLIYEAMMDPESRFPLNDDAYLKAWALTKPRLPYTVIYGDEWQDANPVMLDVIEQQTHAQRIYVGDANQSIYSWRGAVDALSALDALPAYPLTQSFRFGPMIAKLANSILRAKGRVVVMPLRIRGLPSIEDRVEEIQVPDLVLSRTNAGLFEEAVAMLDYLAPEDRIAFVGGVEEVVSMARAAYELSVEGRTSHREFRFFRNWEDLAGIVEGGFGANFGPFVKLVKNHGDRIPSMCDSIMAAAIKDESRARVLFSTTHKFKGRERKRVKVAGDFPEFCRFDRKRRDWVFSAEEANIAYVALTRAQLVIDVKAYLPLLMSSMANIDKMLSAGPLGRTISH